MATKNLVPRANNEGKIGIPSRKWSEANFSSGSFETLSVDKFSNLKTSSGEALIKNGDNISFEEVAETGQLIISSTAAGGGSSPTSIHGLTDVDSNAYTSGSGGYILSWTSDSNVDNDYYSILRVTQDIEIDAAGIASIQQSAGPRLFLTTHAPVVTALTDNDKFLISRPNDANDLSGVWSNKTITKTNLISELNASVATKFIDLTDVPYSNFNMNDKVKAYVDINNNLTFVPDTNVYRALGDISLSESATESKIVIARNYDSLGLTADPHFSEIDDNSSNWNIAYGWGDHSAEGYATTTTLSDYATTTALGDYIKADGTTDFALTSHIQLNSADNNNTFTIVNVPTPTNSTDTASHIVPKSYVDAISSGIQPFGAVKAATTANLSATLTGNILTSNNNEEFVVDGIISLSVDHRVLVKDQTNKIENGIYKITVVGDSSNPWVLTRTADFADTMDTASGVFVFVEIGTANSSKGFVCISPDGSDTVGTNEIIWSAFSSAGSYSNGNGISISGSNINLDLNQGLTDFGTSEAVKKDDTLAIKDASDSNNTKSIKIEKLLGDVVDASTIEVDTDSITEISKLQIKDLGVTLGKIEKVDRNKLLGFLSTDTAVSDGTVSQIKVGIKGDPDTLWQDADDTVIPTQLSVKAYVDNINSADENIGSSDLDSLVSEVFTLTSSNNTAALTNNYSDYVNKTLTIKLTGNWPRTTNIIIELPPIAKTNNDNELVNEALYSLYDNFIIHINSDDVTNPSDFKGNAARPMIKFKPNSNCGFASKTGYADFGLDNMSRFSKVDSFNGNKILSLHTASNAGLVNSNFDQYLKAGEAKTNQEISLRSVNGSTFESETLNDKFNFALKKGEFIHSGSISGFTYFFDSYGPL